VSRLLLLESLQCVSLALRTLTITITDHISQSPSASGYDYIQSNERVSNATDTRQGYDLGKKLVKSFSTVENGQFTTGQICAAGAFSAVPTTAIAAPFERVKVLLQIQGQKTLAPGEKPKYAGGVDVVRQLYREGGIRSVFRGSAMTLARDAPGSAAYFAAYETVKRALTPKNADGTPGELSLLAVMAAGGAAGIAMWIPVFPVDTVKSRLQSADGNPTIGGTVKELYRRGGYKAFFPGIGPAMARAVPANAATFLGVELAQKAMTKMFD
jgi:solute carrier family 25 carnitine/acylcarnitine transporter 20/29